MYIANMATKDDIIHVRVTAGVKRLLAAIVQTKSFNSEAAAIDAVIRAYAETRRVEPMGEEDYEAYKTAKATKQGRKATGE